MFQLPRSLTPVLAAAVIVTMTSAVQAQFFFGWGQPSTRQAPARKAPVRQGPDQLPAFDPAPVSDKASFNDKARYLAGLAPSEDFPIAKFTREPSWQQHARSFDHSWRELEARRLSKIRLWSEQNLKDHRAPLYYMFSGPDLLYASAFFPNASTYILAGLEPVGRIPQINERTLASLGNLRSSMASSISLSFFITKNMKSQLRETALSGTLPILLVYAARAGKTITDVSLVTIEPDGTVTPGNASQRGVQGAKIVMGGDGRPEQTLYYFSTDISDGGVKNSGFLKFAETFGPGDAMFKSASYLPHSGGFSQIRDFVLGKAQSIVQDDSGIPIHHFPRDQWTFHAFGRYLGPIAIFPGRHQNSLAEIHRKGPFKPLDFGMGYRWRPNESNVLLATRKDLSAHQLRPAVATQPASPPPVAEPVPAVQAAPPVQPAAAAEPAPAAPSAPPPGTAEQSASSAEDTKRQ